MLLFRCLEWYVTSQLVLAEMFARFLPANSPSNDYEFHRISGSQSLSKSVEVQGPLHVFF